jgi:hypothetical protein
LVTLPGLPIVSCFCLIVRSAVEEESDGGKGKRDGRIAEAEYHRGTVSRLIKSATKEQEST